MFFGWLSGWTKKQAERNNLLLERISVQLDELTGELRHHREQNREMIDVMRLAFGIPKQKRAKRDKAKDE